MRGLTTERWAPYLAIGTQVFGLAMGFGCNLLMARVGGAASYGEYAFAYSLAVMLAVPIEVGLVLALIRDGTASWAADRPGEVKALSHAAIWGGGFYVGACASCALAVLLIWPELAGAYRDALVVACFLLPFSAGLTLRGAMLRIAGKPLASQMISSVARPVFFLFALALVLLLGTKLSGQMLMLLQVGAAALAWAVLIWLQPLPWRFARAATEAHPWRRWRQDVPSLSLMAVAMAVSQATGGVMVAHHLAASEVGQYRLAELAASLVAMPLSTLSTYHAASLAQKLAQADRLGLQTLLTQAGKVATMAASVVLLSGCIVGPVVLTRFFDEDFRGALMPMVVLMAGQLLTTLAGLSGAVASMGGMQQAALKVLVVSTLAQWGLGMVLIPLWGVLGAACAATLANLLWSQWLRIKVARQHGVQTSWLSGM